MSFNEINKALDIDSDDIVSVDKTEVEVGITKPDIDRDYEYTRGQLYSLIEKGQEAIDGIMEISQETGSARAYEVTGQIIKSVADATDKLLDLQKKLRDIEDPKEKGPSTVNNALFVGSTAELQKLLKKGKLDD
tara:strand:+ start:724 stop:1125 length:402 start_codon:yes stop_codon:yes gene_type:complete